MPSHDDDKTTEHPAYLPSGAPPARTDYGTPAGEAAPQAPTAAWSPSEPQSPGRPPEAVTSPPPPPRAATSPLSEKEASSDTEPWQVPTPPAAGASGWQSQPQPAQQTFQQPAVPSWQQQPAQSWQHPQAAPPPVPPPPAPGPWNQAPYGPQPNQPPAYGQQFQQPYPAQPYGQGPYQQPYAQPQYAPAQDASGPRYGTSRLAALAGVLLIALGIGVAVLGAWTLTQGPEISRFIRDNDVAVFGRQVDRETLRSILSPMPGVLMVMGVLHVLVGLGVLRHKKGARWIGVLLGVVGLLLGVFAVSAALALAPGLSLAMIVGLALLLGYALVVLALIAGGSHFKSRRAAR